MLVPITDDPVSWYVAADVVVSASDLGSMPRSLIEAMACGRVVLSSDVFGVPELIRDGQTGLLMGDRDLHALVDGLERVLCLSPAARSQIGHAAAAHVRQSHDATHFVSVYRDLLTELCPA
jgi:D-inositol-3-phosphate glycosyltransferase